MKTTFTAIFLLVFPAIVMGHHSRAEFTNETIEIEGKLTNVIWRNPHIALFLDVQDESGEIQNWRIEGSTNPITLKQSGVNPELIKVGDQVVALGEASRFRQALLVTNVLLPNGSEVLMAPSAVSHWNGPTIGGASYSPQMANVDADKLGFFRAWYPAGNPMATLKSFPYSDDALAARDDWDPINNPIARCEQPGMPVPLFHRMPILFSEQGDNISLHHGYFDTLRTIHMDEALNEEEQLPSFLGFSKGKWEDRNTLVIETSRINYPYFDFNGTSQSESIKVTERYALSDDKTRLDFQVTIDDPVALTQTASAKWHFVALDQDFSAYECNLF